jgi:CBS domain-containing protein
MADNTKPQDRQGATPGAEAVARRTEAAANDTVQVVSNAARRSAEGGAAATEQGAHTVSEASRQAGEVGAQALRQGGEAAGELSRRGTAAAAEGGQHIVEAAAQQLEEVGRSLAEAVQGTAEDMRRLMLVPIAADGGLRDMQQALGGLVEGVMRSNLRATQELLRLANPGAMVQLQRRFMHEYLDALLEGQTTILRAARRTADETLRPLERQAEERRQNGRQNQQRQQRGGRVADVMTREMRVVSPEETVQQAARLMREEDTGVLPVGEQDRLVGMVTDRDIAVRVAAEGRNPAQTRVREVMTPEVRYVFEDEDLHRAAETMTEQQVRRLPVLNRDKRLVGVVSMGDLATEGQTPRLAGRALAGVAQEGGRHNQTVAAE